MEGQLDRRTFLRGAAGLAAAATATRAVPSSGLATAAGKTLARPVRGARFRQGVASGAPSAKAITLWTKVAEAERWGTLTLEVAREPGFDRVVERRRVRVGRQGDFAAKARVGGLKPAERYWYRFESRNRSSPVGTFKTLAPANSALPVRIGVFSCQDYGPGYYTAHAGLAAESELDLIVCLGDYIYERTFYQPAVRADRLGANGDGEVQTLREYRQKYALYHSDANLRAVRQSAPLMAIWDDHEVEDNYAGGQPGDATLDSRVAFQRRRRNAYRAFFEHMPFGPAGHRERDRFRIYRSLRLGRHAELLLLDQRQYRDDQPCGDATLPIPPCPPQVLSDPSRTLLGQRQKRWLKHRLRASDATWKLVGNQAMAMSLDIPNGFPLNMDQWDGYAAERREILSDVAARGIENVSFLTGDIHTFFAGGVSPTGRQDLLRQPAAVASEFVAGSMTSLGVPETVKAMTGVPLPSNVTALLADAVALRLTNPHLRYSNSERRGYAVVHATGDALRVSFRSPASTKSPESAVATLKRLEVTAGSTEVGSP